MFARKFISSLFVASLLLTSCSSSSENVAPQYVSPLQYQSYNCNQIRMELQRVSRRVNEIAGIQDGKAQKDSVALGVGLVLFWPALFFMPGKDKEEELGRLKGEYEALERAAIEKECDVAAELDEARKMAEERKEKQSAAQDPAKAMNE